MVSMDKLKKIKTDTIQSQVYNKIKNMIIDGKWLPGDKIPSESMLSEMLGVGRVSIRSALQYLSAQGYIETKRGEGSYVKALDLTNYIDFISPMLELSKQNYKDIIEIRKIIEPNLIPLVIKNIQDKDIIKLKSILKKMLKNKDNTNIFSKYDLLFHCEIAKITGNTLIINVLGIIWSVFLKSMKKNVEITPDRKKYSISYHKKILSAIINKDAKLAKKLMRKHLNNTQKNLFINLVD